MNAFHDQKPSSRLARKTLGVTNRIWLILSLILALVLVTRFILPYDSTPTRHKLIHADLKPINYLNMSDGDTMPFSFCPALGPADDLAIKYDPLTLAKTRIHMSSNARVQRVITRALSGYPVTISVLGGSVSACHGAGDDPLSPTCYPSRFFHWWNDVFPHPASELTNGAMRRTNSAYFSFCNAHHVPDLTDLVIVELDTDDTGDAASLDNFELLIRSLLIRPDQPAVLILGHFSPQVQDSYGFQGPDHWHSLVAQFYDVPHISIKPLFYNDYISNPSKITGYYADPVLANPKGHAVIADVLTSYFQSQICAAWAAATGTSHEALPGPGVSAPHAPNARLPTDAKGLFGGVAERKGAVGAAAPEPWWNGNDRNSPDQPAAGGAAAAKDGGAGGGAGAGRSLNQQLYPHLRVPQARINARPADYAAHPFEEVAPFCVSANDLINPLPSSMFSGSGWAAFHPPPGSAELASHAHYWYSSLPTSRLRVGIQVGAGDVGVYYLKESVGSVGVGSAVECWVDDNYKGAVIIENSGQVGEPTPMLEVIDHHVSRGSHFVECQLMGEEGQRDVPPFKIIGIFAT